MKNAYYDFNERPVNLSKSSLTPPPPSFIPAYNSYYNLENDYIENNFEYNDNIYQSPKPRSNIECPMPSMPDEKPINRQNISMIRDTMPFEKYDILFIMNYFFIYFIK